MDAAAKEALLAKDVEQQNVEDVNEDIKEFDDLIRKGLTNALHGSANLANMLPTGSVLFFNMLDPILFRAGSCQDKNLSAAFLVVCGLVSFILSFTDSFQAPNGKVYYGLATFKGLWTPQLRTTMDLSKYRIQVADFAHAFLALFTFFTTTSFSTDVISCFITIPESFTRMAPALSGSLVSFVFVLFPSTRHGVGFPISPPAATSAGGAGSGAGPAGTGDTGGDTAGGAGPAPAAPAAAAATSTAAATSATAATAAPSSKKQKAAGCSQKQPQCS